MAPWIFLLFIGLLDFGFYAYSAIATANAARVAALYTSSQSSASADAAGACYLAVEEMRMMNNVVSAATPCPTCSGDTCSSGPVTVRVRSFQDATCPDYVAGMLDPPTCSQVAITYQGDQMIPIPGLMGKFSLTRVVLARVKPN